MMCSRTKRGIACVAAGAVLLPVIAYFASDRARGVMDDVYFGLIRHGGEPWSFKTPSEVGLDAAGLDAFSDYVGGRGCVVRNGHMVYTWGNQWNRGNVASAAKPVYTHFLLKAIEEGKLRSLDDRVNIFEPRLNELNAALGYKDRTIQWRHLVCQVSCYGVREQPGEAFDYSNYNITLLVDTLFLNVYGSPMSDWDKAILHPGLTDALGCQDNPTFTDLGGRLNISVRDFARIGLLYLRKGNWNGEQLISEQRAVMAVTSPLPASTPRSAGEPAAMIPGQRLIARPTRSAHGHLGSYSYTWWTNGIDRHGNRHWPDAPPDTYGAIGGWGPMACFVIPNLDIVVSWNRANVREQEMVNGALGLLTKAVIKREDKDP